MAKLFPLEASNGDTRAGGFIVEFPSGARKEVSWVRAAPVIDATVAAKETITQLVDDCLRAGLIDDLERTNVPSLVAAAQRIILDWNERRRAALYAERDASPTQ